MEFRRTQAEAPVPGYSFEDTTLFESQYAILRFTRKFLRPVLKLFFSPNPLIHALHVQAELNTRNARRDELQYELIHNLVLETTRLGIQVKNLKMQVESMSSRLDFDERRARALEGVVQYRPGAVAPLQPPVGGPKDAAPEDAQAQERRSRRRRRRGRRPGSGRDENDASLAAASGRGDREPGAAEPGFASGREENGPGFGRARPSARENGESGFGRDAVRDDNRTNGAARDLVNDRAPSEPISRDYEPSQKPDVAETVVPPKPHDVRTGGDGG